MPLGTLGAVILGGSLAAQAVSQARATNTQNKAIEAQESAEAAALKANQEEAQKQREFDKWQTELLAEQENQRLAAQAAAWNDWMELMRPYYATGAAAQGELLSLLGVSGGGGAMPSGPQQGAIAPAPGPAMEPMSDAAPTGPPPEPVGASARSGGLLSAMGSRMARPTSGPPSNRIAREANAPVTDSRGRVLDLYQRYRGGPWAAPQPTA